MEKNYEITFIVPGNFSSEESDNILEEVKSLIKDLGGAITNEKRWGSRKLAYLIARQDKGFYYTLNFDFETSKIAEFSRTLEHHKNILRHLITESYKNAGKIVFEKGKGRVEVKKTQDVKEVKVNEKEREKKLDEALEKILVE